MTLSWQQTSLESLDIGATPLINHFFHRLRLAELLEKHLPPLPGRQPTIPSSRALLLLVSNLLQARQPLYALPAWAARRVPDLFGLDPEQVAGLNDDRLGRALDHLRKADRASLLTALVVQAVREFQLDMRQFHQDTTTVTVHGAFDRQAPVETTDRPPRLTFGYNKDHRPDLKQLLFSITITDDGAVPVHCKLYDGNTTDDAVHVDTWKFLCQVVSARDFLYVADSKSCTRENMAMVAAGQGRFLTVMPRTRSEDGWFRTHLETHPVAWEEVHREANPRRRDGPDVVYHGAESPARSTEGYRVLWYRSSQKEESDRQGRQRALQRARADLEDLLASARRSNFATADEARLAGQRILTEAGAERWLVVDVESAVSESFRQAAPGRPGPNTAYRRVETVRHRPRFREDGEALARDGKTDGLFPLMTNDERLTVREALEKYKYQPFVEKRHEQLKTVFGVAPVWLKAAGRIESLLWLDYIVELVQALIEREVRKRMAEQGQASLALYPEGRASTAPTCELVFAALEGVRRHRLLGPDGQELRRFHDALPEAGVEVLRLIGVELSPWGAM